MRIAFCNHISLSYGGGGETWTFNFATYLKKRGHDIEIFSLPYNMKGRRVVDPVEVLKRSDIPYHESWKHNVDSDVAYVFYHPLAYLSFKCNCPKIAGIHSNVYFLRNNPPISYGIPPLFARLLYKAIGTADLSLYDAVHMVNTCNKIKHRRVFHVPNFVDTKIFKPAGEKRANFTVLFVGRPNWQKGWDTYIDIARMLKNKYEIDFLWAGGREDKIEKIIHSLGYITDTSEIVKLYSSVHLTICPSRVDSFNLTIIESLACGTPVLTTPLPVFLSLELPLDYASNTFEFAKRIVEMYTNWENDRHYLDVNAIKLRNSVMKYSTIRVMPLLERMLERVSM